MNLPRTEFCSFTALVPGLSWMFRRIVLSRKLIPAVGDMLRIYPKRNKLKFTYFRCTFFIAYHLLDDSTGKGP